jgi:general secretion pathway protein I
MRRNDGFTLLEALVALTILAVGLSATMRSLGVAAGAAGELRDRRLADWVAQNRLAELRVFNRFPAAGSAEGDAVQGGRTFHWREEVAATPNPLFRRVDVRVFAADDDGVLSHLTGFAVRPLK